jgi:hypothetical protein
MVKVDPEIVATLVFELLYVTGLPDAPPVADKVIGPSPYVAADKALNTIDCVIIVAVILAESVG